MTSVSLSLCLSLLGNALVFLLSRTATPYLSLVRKEAKSNKDTSHINVAIENQNNVTQFSNLFLGLLRQCR
jgi:hypothetical protein